MVHSSIATTCVRCLSLTVLRKYVGLLFIIVASCERYLFQAVSSLSRTGPFPVVTVYRKSHFLIGLDMKVVSSRGLLKDARMS